VRFVSGAIFFPPVAGGIVRPISLYHRIGPYFDVGACSFEVVRPRSRAEEKLESKMHPPFVFAAYLERDGGSIRMDY